MKKAGILRCPPNPNNQTNFFIARNQLATRLFMRDELSHPAT